MTAILARMMRPADSTPLKSRTSRGACVLGLAAVLMIASCAQLAVGADSPVEARKTVAAQERQRERQQHDTTLLLERFSAQMQLSLLGQTHVARQRRLQALQKTFDQMKEGPVLRSDLTIAEVILAKASVELVKVAAALKAGLTSYEAHYHERIENTELVAPVWDKRFPASKEAMLEMVRQEDKSKALTAWHRVQDAISIMAQQDQQTEALDTARTSYAQQFASRQLTLRGLAALEIIYPDPRIERVRAHTELLKAKAAVLALIGRLRSDDLPSVPKAGTVSLGLLVDPGEPSLTSNVLGASPANFSKLPTQAPIPAQINLLDRFSAQLQLSQLVQTHTFRREQLQTAKRTFEQIKLRSDRGVGRRADVDRAAVVLAKTNIDLLEVDAALASGLASYEAHYHERIERTKLVEPDWADRWPASMAEMLEMVPEGGRSEVVIAWQRVRSADNILVQQDRHTKTQNAASIAHNQLFSIGRRTLVDLLESDIELIDSRIERMRAQTELLNAKAVVLALLGRLRTDDLPFRNKGR